MKRSFILAPIHAQSRSIHHFFHPQMYQVKLGLWKQVHLLLDSRVLNQIGARTRCHQCFYQESRKHKAEYPNQAKFHFSGLCMLHCSQPAPAGHIA